MGTFKDKELIQESHDTLELTPRERQIIEIIARRAAERAADIVLDTLGPERMLDLFYDHLAKEIGKGIIRKGLWAVGLIVAAVFFWFSSWLAAKGFLK